MGAFQGAVDIGAHAIETDLHLTKDGVVVLVHVCLFVLKSFSSTTYIMVAFADILSTYRRGHYAR